MKALGGIVCVRNGIRFDYCWKQSIESLLPVCRRIVVCDSDSDDGTSEEIRKWASSDNRILYANYPWTDPVADPEWVPRWINYCRPLLETQWFIQLDADEVIHEDDQGVLEREIGIGSPLFCKRINFWRNPQNLIPEGQCVGTKVLRVAPIHMPIGIDAPYPPAAPTEALARESSVRVYHYGFLRNPKAFLHKARAVHKMFLGTNDPKLEEAFSFPGHWVDIPGLNSWSDKLSEFTGTHPKVIHEWLRERGHRV